MCALRRLPGRMLALLAACAPLARQPIAPMAVPAFRGITEPALAADANELLGLDDGMRLFVSEQLAPIEDPALALEPDNLSALNNLALLAQQRGHAFTARRLLKRVERYRSANPYFL